MTPKQPTARIRKSPEQVRSAVHQAVIDLLSAPAGAELTIPAIAQHAGVNHTSIYRRWGSREALLADVVTTRLERDWPLNDTGTLRGDLIAWAQAGVASIRTPEGRLLVRAVALSMPSSADAQAERAQHFQRRLHAIERIRERATARGENPPAAGADPRSAHRTALPAGDLRYRSAGLRLSGTARGKAARQHGCAGHGLKRGAAEIPTPGRPTAQRCCGRPQAGHVPARVGC